MHSSVQKNNYQMIDNKLLSKDQLDPEEYAVTPDPDHLVPDSIERERRSEAFRAKLRGDPDAIIITHTDADGLSSAALLADYAGDVAIEAIDYHGAYQFDDVLGDILDLRVVDTPIYISDFALDGEGAVFDIQLLGQRDCPITWFDHHQWDDELVDRLEDVGVDVIIDDEECATSLIARELGPYPDHLEDLAECTKDIDLWIRDDPRSERLNVFASLVDEPEDYVYTVLEEGTDLPEDVQDRIDERLERDRELEEYAIENRTSTTIEGLDVAFTYSSGGRSSTIGNELAEDLGFDIAVVMKTHGGIGIYSHSNRESFARCHAVADHLGGGGHPTAAGCSVPVSTFRELADFWATRGASVRLDIFDAIQAIVLLEGVEADD